MSTNITKVEEQLNVKYKNHTHQRHLDVAVVTAWLAKMGGVKEVDVDDQTPCTKYNASNAPQRVPACTLGKQRGTYIVELENTKRTMTVGKESPSW